MVSLVHMNLLLAAVLLLPFLLLTDAKTCLMVYMNADSEKSFFLQDDYQELIRAPAITTQHGVRLWVYFDAYNRNPQTLPDTVNTNGDSIVGPFAGSRYITYDTTLKVMRIDQELGEQNSDTIASMQSFLEHALLDCTRSGHNESLMATFSAYGGGFAGFGGDHHRQLLQGNAGIATAIANALGVTAGKDKLDVLGFDGSLMMAVEAVDDYAHVARTILASETVVPGQGWKYSSLSGNGTHTQAADLAQDIYLSYFTQGGAIQKTPKSLSMVDTANFPVFIQTWEAFAEQLLSVLQQGDDTARVFVWRARDTANAYTGLADSLSGSVDPSSLDIGSFLDQFNTLCQPSGPFRHTLQATQDAYDNLFIATRVGRGSQAGTGMHILWPTQPSYKSNPPLWNKILYEIEKYKTKITPNYHALLQYILSDAVPSNSSTTMDGTTSICSQSATIQSTRGVRGPFQNGELIVSDAGFVNSGGAWDLSADISTDVSQVAVRYGVNYTSPLKPILYQKGYENYDGEYMFLLYGQVQSNYRGSTVQGLWDQNFYVLNITNVGEVEPVFVFEKGNGAMQIPALYFPADKTDEVSNLQYLDYLFYDYEYWTEQGAQFAFLTFSVNGVGRINNNLALYVADQEKGGVFGEKSREVGGYVVPLTYMDSYVQNRALTILPGGLNQRIFEWKPDYDYRIDTVKATEIGKFLPDIDNVLVNLIASDGGRRVEVRYFDALKPGSNSSACPFPHAEFRTCHAESDGTADGGEGSDARTRGVGVVMASVISGLSALVGLL